MVIVQNHDEADHNQRKFENVVDRQKQRLQHRLSMNRHHHHHHSHGKRGKNYFISNNKFNIVLKLKIHFIYSATPESKIMSPPASKGTPKKETAAAKRAAPARQRVARQNSNVKSREYLPTDSSSSDDEHSPKKRAVQTTNSPRTTNHRQSNENLHLNNGNGTARTPTTERPPKQSRQKAISKIASPAVSDNAGDVVTKSQKGKNIWSSPRQVRNSRSPRGASSIRSKMTATSSEDDDDDDDEDNSTGSKSGKATIHSWHCLTDLD